MSYKYFGLLAVAILILGLTFIIWKWPYNRHKTFSQHVARRNSSIIYYVGLFGITLPLLLLFFIKWFTPTFGITHWFNVLLIVSCIAQFACTVVPELGATRTRYHRILAGVSGFCLLPALGILLFTINVQGLSKLLVGIGILTMLFIIYQSIRAKGRPKDFLLLQIAYYLAFFIPILYISY